MSAPTKQESLTCPTQNGESLQTEAATTQPQPPTTTALAIWGQCPKCPSRRPDRPVISVVRRSSLRCQEDGKFGRMTDDVVVVIFRQIMDRYDGRQATRPPMKVEEAFASIGLKYEAVRKLVYRDRKKRELEAIAASLHLPTASTPATSIFHADDEVTTADGDGVIQHVHQTTGKFDMVLDETKELIDSKHVTKLNGAPVIDGNSSLVAE